MVKKSEKMVVGQTLVDIGPTKTFYFIGFYSMEKLLTNTTSSSTTALLSSIISLNKTSKISLSIMLCDNQFVTSNIKHIHS